MDGGSDWAGSIRLNIPLGDKLPTGDACELIALASGIAKEGGYYAYIIDEWGEPERPRESTHYKFYYVMWIERERGIAYRKAIGTVYKGAWESQLLEQIDVIFG